jgi:hypothetical protein
MGGGPEPPLVVLGRSPRPQDGGEHDAQGRDDETDDPGVDLLRAEDRRERGSDPDHPQSHGDTDGDSLQGTRSVVPAGRFIAFARASEPGHESDFIRWG